MAQQAAQYWWLLVPLCFTHLETAQIEKQLLLLTSEILRRLVFHGIVLIILSVYNNSTARIWPHLSLTR
jgi:hypothetical protein